MKTSIPARDRLIVALDLSDIDAARAMVKRLGDSVSFYKVGYQLGFAGGLPLIGELADAGKQVFADFKLHDIGNTVTRGVESLSRLGATFLTVHAYPQVMRAAASADRGKARVLGVTVLTSLSDEDLAQTGSRHNVADLVTLRARQAQECGIDGIVSSPEEVDKIRAIVEPRMALVTPGIRPAGAAAGDQKRIMTPARAMAAGADYLVVGRPVMEADDPKAAAETIVQEIAGAT